MYVRFLKRIIDASLSFIGLLFLMPFMILLSIILAVVNNGRVFFKQARPGKGEKQFFLYKFCTMSDIRDSNGVLLDDDKRMTNFGKFLRKWSLDELPQLWNVFKGDMSLVGPRPLLVQYLNLYNDHQRRRHEVLPGITGWAQVNGRNAIDWKTKFEYDVWYVDHVSFWLDMKILIMTIRKIIDTDGIYSRNDMKTNRFDGN